MFKNRLKLFTIVLGLAILVSPFQMFAQELKSAILLTQSEQFDEAENMFKTILQKEPNNSDAYFYFGENYIKAYFADTISTTLKEALDFAKAKYKKGTEVDSVSALNFVGLAKVALFSGDNKLAQMYFNKVRSLLPHYKKVSKIKEPYRYAMVLSKMAECYIKGEIVDTSRALPLLREAQDIDQNQPSSAKVPAIRNAEIYIIAGNAFLLSNDGSNAIRNYNKANEIDPKSPLAKIKIGNIYVRSRNLQAAIPHFEEAIVIDPEFSPAYRELGELYNLAGKFEKAKANYKKYLELTKGNIPAKVRYAISLYSSKDFAEAIIQIEEILKVDKSRNYLNRIAAFSCYEKRPPEYQKGLEFIQTYFKNADPAKTILKDYAYHGRLLLKVNADFNKPLQDSAKINREIDKAHKDCKKVTKPSDKKKCQSKIDSLHNKFKEVYDKIKLDSTEIEKGFARFLVAYSMDTTDYDMVSEIAANYYTYKKFTEAAIWYNKKIQRNGANDVNDFMYKGKAYYQDKEYNKAETVFIDVTKMQPDLLDGYLWIANTYASLDPDSKKGLAKPKYETLVEKALTDTVKNAKYLVDSYSYLGSYYFFTTQEYAKAKPYYHKMISIDPKNTTWLVKGNSTLGMIHSKMKEYPTAIYYYKKVLELEPSNKNAKDAIEQLQKALKK